jgi:drug/metabolite transporter (DMT)-like permease
VSATVLGLVLFSAFLHAAWSASIKGSASPLAFTLAQHLLLLPLAVAGVASVAGELLTPRLLACAAGTALAHGLYGYWLALALERADLTLAYPIVRSTPALLPLLAVPVLGETPSPLGAAGIAVVVGGIWLVHGSGPTLRALGAPALRYAWLTLLATVGYSLSDKAAMQALAGSAYHGWLAPALVWYCVIIVASSVVFLPLAFRRVRRTHLERTLRAEGWRAAAAVGVSLIGYGLILTAFEQAPASYVVAVRQSSVLFAAWIGVAFLGERPDRGRLAGAAATVAGVALIGWAG